MTNDIATIQSCIYLRNGIEIWVNEDKAISVREDLISGNTTDFIVVEGRTINVKEVVGIFNATDLEDLKRRKQGLWKCEYNTWHNKNEVCDCGRFTKEERERYKR